MAISIGRRGNPYDVIIVGAGATGAWAAMRLGAAGMNVLLLDAGPNRPKASPWRGRLESLLGRFSKRRRERLRELEQRRPIQSLCYAWAGDPGAFVDDIDNPYVFTGEPFFWFRARQVGGRLAVKDHGRRFIRFTDQELKAASHDGHGVDWPVSEQELAPYYASVERRVGLVPRECNVTERWLKSVLERPWPGRGLVPISKLNPPDLIAMALRTGNVTLQAEAIASHLELDSNSNEVNAVAVIDATTHACREYYGRRVFMCASTVESTRVLLNSRSARYPEGIGNVYGVLGRHFMEQVHVFARVRLPAARRDAWLPPQPAELFVPFVRDPAAIPTHARGFGVQVMAKRMIGGRDAELRLSSFGEMLPRAENRVRLSATARDKWGLPVVEIDHRLSENEKLLMDEQRRFLGSLRAADLEVEVEDPTDKPLGFAIHEVGTARMGADPRTSFVDPNNRSWEVKNLFVTDGGCFVTSGYQNPTLTMLALTERACAHAVQTSKS